MGGVVTNKYGVENPSTPEVQNFSILTKHSTDKPAEVGDFLDKLPCIYKYCYFAHTSTIISGTVHSDSALCGMAKTAHRKRKPAYYIFGKEKEACP